MPFEFVQELLECDQKQAIAWAKARHLRTKIFVGHHTLCFRVRPKWKKLIQDALASYQINGVVYEVDGNLSWHECLFTRVQVFR